MLAGKCSTQNSYAEQILIFLHQMLVSRCHRLVKSLETPQKKICEYICGGGLEIKILWWLYEKTYIPYSVGILLFLIMVLKLEAALEQV